MSRPLRSLRLLLWPILALLALLQFIFILDLLFSPDPPRESFVFCHLCATVLLATLYGWQYRWLWRFRRRVRPFATIENSRIVLHYESELEGTSRLFMQSCENELDNLTRWFGSPLRKRVVVYLFANCRDISAIFGSDCGGCAISRVNAIVLASDSCVPEVMRHELTHLFASRWSVCAPPLLTEGLAVWMQGNYYGRSIDGETLILLRQGNPRLPLLLRLKYFLTESQQRSCYILAGSFTGFLIRRYGWKNYRKLYRSCDGIRFKAKFQKCFGISLKEAECQWRHEVVYGDGASGSEPLRIWTPA